MTMTLRPQVARPRQHHGARRGGPAAAFILLRNWVIWPLGRGSRCCRILRRRTGAGALLGAARQRLWGSPRYRTLNFASLTSQTDRDRFAGGGTKEDGNS